MKKTYISPAIDVTIAVAEQMLAASIDNISGNSGIQQAEEEEDVPDEADVKSNFFGESIFDY